MKKFMDVGALDGAVGTEWRREIEYETNGVMQPTDEDGFIDIDGSGVKDTSQSEEASIPEEPIEDTLSFIAVDLLIIVQPFSKIKLPTSTKDSYLNETKMIRASGTTSPSISFLSQVPDTSAIVLHVPYISATTSLATPDISTSAPAPQTSSSSDINISIPRIDIQTWPSYLTLLLWRLDIEPLSILMTRINSEGFEELYNSTSSTTYLLLIYIIYILLLYYLSQYNNAIIILSLLLLLDV